MDKHAVARTLQYHRTRQGLTQEQLAEQSGVAIRTIQRIEAGGALPHPSTLALLAGGLRLPVQELTIAAALNDAAPAAPEPPGPAVTAGQRALLHLLPLLGLVLPLVNVLVPLLYWVYLRDADPEFDRQGRMVVNFQLTLLLGTALGVGLLLTFFPAGALLLAGTWLLLPWMSLVNARRARRGRSVRYPGALPLLGRPAADGGPVAAT